MHEPVQAGPTVCRPCWMVWKNQIHCVEFSHLPGPLCGSWRHSGDLGTKPREGDDSGKTGEIPGHPEILVERESEGWLSGGGVFTETEGVRAGRVRRQREQHVRLGRSQHDNGNVPILGAKVWLELGEVGSGAVWGGAEHPNSNQPLLGASPTFQPAGGRGVRTRAWTVEFGKGHNRECRAGAGEGFGPHNLHQDPKP